MDNQHDHATHCMDWDKSKHPRWFIHCLDCRWVCEIVWELDADGHIQSLKSYETWPQIGQASSFYREHQDGS